MGILSPVIELVFCYAKSKALVCNFLITFISMDILSCYLLMDEGDHLDSCG